MTVNSVTLRAETCVWYGGAISMGQASVITTNWCKKQVKVTPID